MLYIEEHIDGLDTGALLSPCRRWRYLLWRRWDREKPPMAFIGLNPSTADETVDDQTIRKCRGYAQRWGYGAFWMLNIFAYRARDPNVMKAQGANAIGPRNNEYLAAATASAGLTVAAWGAHGTHLNRANDVCELLAKSGVTVHILGLTQGLQPKHPLYLPGDLKPVPWIHGQSRRLSA